MLRHKYAFVLAAVILAVPTIGLCAGTPESTLEEMIFADKVDTVIQHLPPSIGDAWKKLPASDRANAADQLLIVKRLEQEHLKISKTEFDQWDVVDDKGEIKGHVRLRNSFVSGIDAMIVLELSEVRENHEEHSRSSLAFIVMQLQEGEWRLTSIGGGELRNIEDMIGEFVPNRRPSEASAVGSLRTLNVALITYRATYPDVGYALSIESLGDLGGDNSDKPSAQHAGLIDNHLASGVKSGYQFHYTRLGKDAYTITARLVEPQNGARSFFTDQTGVIRFTKEDREANSTDDPL